MPAPRDPIHSSASAEPTLVVTPPGRTPDARLVDPNAPTMTPQGLVPGDTLRPGMARAPRAEDAPAPASIARFTVLRELGRGGTGVVYAAYDEQLDRKVAVKLLHSETREDLARVRLLREAQAMARLAHPNIVGVHEVGTFGRQVYVAMEFVHGLTLHSWLKRQRRGFSEIAAMFRQAGEGLAAAHQAGLVHRDFKPANVMVGDDGRVRVLDFGLARAEVTPGAAPGLDGLESADEHTSAVANLRSLDASITLTGLMLGTPAYMAPEQFLGTRVDARSDQFAFCVALYEAAYRRRPFAGDTLAELMSHVLAGAIVDTPTPHGIPRGLRPLLLRGLSRNPDDRWPAMRPLLDALAPFARPPARRAWFFTAGASVAALVVGGGLMASHGDLIDRVCGGGEEQIAAVWNPEVRAQIDRLAADSGLATAAPTWARAAAGFDAYSEAWLAGYADACDESGEELDLRMACLAERREALSTAVGMFTRLDAELLAHAEPMVSQLPRVEACADEAYLRAKIRPPDDPAVVAQVHALQKTLKSVEMLETGGKLSEALAMLEPAIAAAPANYPPLRAELAFRHGSLLENDGRYEPARDAFEEAFFFAVAAGHHEVMIDAATRLAYINGRRLGEPAVGQDWLRHAELYAARHDDPLRRGSASIVRGALANHASMMGARRDKVIEARDAFLDARRRLAEARAEDTVEFARLLRFHGDHMASVGDREGAIETQRRSLDLMRRRLGPQHPDVAMVHNSHGLALSAAKREEEALATLREGLDAAVDLPNQRNHIYMTLWFNTAMLLQKLGRGAEAEAAMREAIAVLERSSERLLRETFILKIEQAKMIKELGRLPDAEVLLREALAQAERTWGADDPLLMDALVLIADIRRDSGDPQAAVELAERALHLAQTAHDESMRSYQHRIGWTLARALADTGEVTRALELTRAAHAHAVANDTGMDQTRWIVEMEAFINKHMAARGKR